MQPRPLTRSTGGRRKPFRFTTGTRPDRPTTSAFAILFLSLAAHFASLDGDDRLPIARRTNVAYLASPPSATPPRRARPAGMGSTGDFRGNVESHASISELSQPIECVERRRGGGKFPDLTSRQRVVRERPVRARTASSRRMTSSLPAMAMPGDHADGDVRVRPWAPSPLEPKTAAVGGASRLDLSRRLDEGSGRADGCIGSRDRTAPGE